MCIPGYVVQGSTGEVANMSADERVEIVKRLRQFVPKSSGKLLIAGCGCECRYPYIKEFESFELIFIL